jgi:uncharacterized protein (DUF952 family)
VDLLETIYHICQKVIWDEAIAKKSYQPESLIKEGFIHCSKFEQVLRVANDFYHSQKDLVLLVIEPAKIKSEIRWEPGNDKPDELFPHIYGPINIEAVREILKLNWDPDDQFHLL